MKRMKTLKRLHVSVCLLVILAMLAILGGCGNSAADGDDVFEITERFFAVQMFEVLMDSENFLGRTIRYEGVFTSQYWDATGEYFHLVYRYTEGCCGPEEPIGLEVYLNDLPQPSTGAWVEVTGILERFYADGVGFLRLNVVSLVEMDVRGSEFVSSL